MGNFVGYRCSVCQSEYLPDEVMYTCPKDGGNLDVVLDYHRIRQYIANETLIEQKEQSLWRYLHLLPVSDPGYKNTPLRSAGYTPIYSPPLLLKSLGVKHLWIKDESGNPTASFKDRASAVVVARAKEIDAEVVVTASTGNAGAALAGMAAAVNQRAVIFAPKSAPPAKIAQLLVYGATVLLVDGNYDAAFDLSIQAAEEFSWYCRNTGFNPFTAEGKKTAAFEIWEFVKKQYPDMSFTRLNVIVSVGDGNIISGIHKGFRDLMKLDLLDGMPRIYGVQARGSSAIANAFKQQTEKIQPVVANTIADSISVDLPRDGLRALRAATQTDGAYIVVDDDAILKSIAELGKYGIFAEPAGATSFAGYQKALHQGLINTDDVTIVINTGNGLKDIKAAMDAVSSAPVIEPSLSAVKKALHY